MILLERTTFHGQQVVALFGVGLIGQAILDAISSAGLCRIREFSFTWNAERHQAQELESIQRYILGLDRGATFPISQIDIVWAAGHSGFGSSEDQIIPEMRAYQNVLSFSLKILNHISDVRQSFHLISSAGGLFEGQKHVDRASLPRPLRPYSHAKIQQEQFLSELPERMRKVIYRLSSVYGFSGKMGRLGLINTLIQNSIRHRSSNIFGNALTIRDYVLASDVGKFVANRLREIDVESCILTLTSGKPTTINEILSRIEKIFGRKIYHTFDNIKENATDISFSSAILPKFWYPTELETGLRQTVRSLKALSLA
jgi:UDP-glucose 4-epimerase